MKNSGEKILIIAYVWPEPASSAAGRRMMELISLFLSREWSVTVSSAAVETEYMADLESRGVERVPVELNSSSFDRFISELQPSIVLYDRFITEEQFGWRVGKECPQALKVLDTQDLHCLRKVREQAVVNDRPFNTGQLLTDKITLREIASIWRSDLSLIISEFEMMLLTDTFEIDKHLLFYLPFLLEKIDVSVNNEWPQFEKRQHFVSIGNFRHSPNRDAVNWLKSEIWPLIRDQLNGAELHVYGAYPTREIYDLHNPDEGFYIEGRAENSGEVLKNARISMAPLRFGAGLKGKLIETMQNGTPSVTTRIGAEGIAGDLSWGGAIADRPEDIATSAMELYCDKERWLKAQKKGVQILNKRFDKDIFQKDFIEQILYLRNNLEKHRMDNFIGAMLRHKSMAASQFMSRWIEEKNKHLGK